MTFKEECLELYEEIGKRNETERKKRVEESIRRQRNEIIKNFERKFNRPFKKEYLIEEQGEYGYILFTIVLDEIRIRVIFRGDAGYYGDYFLLISCHKCGKETTYRNSLTASFLHNIGRILNENPSSAPYLRICGECAEAESIRKKELREANYIERSKERNSDLFKSLADALVEVLKRGGYRDLYNEEDDYHE